MKHHRIATILVAFVLLATGESQADEVGPICGLAVDEEIHERDALALAVELEKTELISAQIIFELLEELWADEATERMRYLLGKYSRDSVRVNLVLRQAHLARQEAYLAWLNDVCSGKARTSSGEVPPEHQAMLDRYVAADCDVRRRDIEYAEIEHEWAGIWHSSIRDLRESHVATKADLLEANYDVRIAEQRLKVALERVQVCEDPKPAAD